ncbi:DUF2252 family protein [Paenibacillus segetis]|uniref:DUF2252 domain-containing protein n=1 Tax=Paenibacillus segetis TaxID=1325360 RepID=A0ABQ1YQQ4_9BACL|nr:DUF2252 family protein [Paenibacillus segetis]GGH34240.1 hypothetical protein GCM10008013_39850 [Paenibacillus segetis]
MPYVERQRTWTKKLTILLMIVLMVNLFANFGGLNSNIANAAESNHVVISKIFGGGSEHGNADYPYDFIELYNPTNEAVDLTNWSVQYADSSSASDSSSWQVTALTGMIPAKGFYFIQEAGNSTLYDANLPLPDAVGTIHLGNQDGKVALVSDLEKLTMENPTNPVSSSLVDFVGYGTAQSYYGSGPAPSLSANSGIIRYALDEDSQDNRVDFGQVDSSSLSAMMNTLNDTYNSQEALEETPEETIEGPVDLSVNSPIVISKVFGGGSQNENALYKYDFIELYNPTDTAVDLSNWSVQYAVSTSKKDANSWEVTPLSGTIPARGYYLIQEAGDATSKVPELPSPNVIGAINLDNKDGKVALVSDSAPLTVVNPSITPVVSSLVDFVGYGAAQSYQGSGATQAPSAQKVIVRKAQDPNNQAHGISAIGEESELYGNGWNSHDNSADFDIGQLGNFSPYNTSSLIPLSVKVDSANNTIKMDSLREISVSDNQFTVIMNTGAIKDGDLNVADYDVNGLPAGLTVSRAVSDSVHKKIMFTISGTAIADVTEDVNLSVVIKKSASTVGAYDDSRTVGGIKLLNNVPKVKGEVVSNKLSMTEPTKASGSFSIHVTTGTVKDGPLEVTDYAITGLPNGLSVQVSGDTVTNTVTFTISGISLSAVTEALPLTVTLKASAVVSGASLDSDPITGVTLDRYKTPVQSDAARKATLTQRIKEANSYYNDPVTKNYKYGTDGMAATGAAFYRGAPYLLYQDLGEVIPLPDNWKNLTNVKTWIEGDAHVANVGFYDDKFGNIIFDLNDFDGAYIAPFYLDLLRMTSSLYLTRDADPDMLKNVSDAEIRNMAKDMLNEYMLSLQSLVGNNDKNTSATKLDTKHISDGFTKTVMNKLAKKTQLDQLIKWTVPTVDGKHSTGVFNVAGKPDKYREPTAAERAEVELNWRQYVDTLSPDFVSAKLAENTNYFAIKDVAVRIYQGLGSIGSQRYNVLIEGPTVSHDDDLILDVKQSFKPDMFENPDGAQTTPYDSFPGGDGARIKTAYEKLSLDAEDFLGYFNSDTRSFFVHKISPYKGDYEDASGGTFKTKDNLADYVSYIAKSYAYAHARSAEYGGDTFEQSVLDQVFNDSDVWNDFQTSLLNLGEDYYRQVKSDYELMKSDLINGRLIDVASLNGLTLDAGKLSPEFDENKLSYTASVSSDVSSIHVTASSLDSKATIKIKGITYTNGSSKSIALSTGVNVIDFVVTAQDGTTTKTYTVAVTRQAVGGGDNNNNNNNNGNTGSNGNTGNGSGSSTTTPTVNTVTATDGKLTLLQGQSGVVSLGSDIVISIPAGASLEELKLSITRVLNTDGLLTNKEILASPVFEMLKNFKQNFNKPVTLTFVFDPAHLKSDRTVAVFYYDEVKKAWMKVEGSKINGNRISVDVNHFTKYAVLIVDKASGLPVTEQSTDIVPEVSFSDIAGHWAEATIRQSVSSGIVQGYLDGTFKPGNAVTRAEFVVMLMNVLQPQGAGTELSFTDSTKIGAWAQKAIAQAVQTGIIKGYGDGSFRPNAVITRSEMATMIANALELPTESNIPTSFKDDPNIPLWAKGAVESLKKLGLIEGTGTNEFHPSTQTTRAEAVTVLLNMLENMSN